MNLPLFLFPFVIAMMNNTKANIPETFYCRIDRNNEFARACRQVKRIAGFRLGEKSAASPTIAVEPFCQTSFVAFGDVIDMSGETDKIVNQRLCGQYHDCARLDFSDGKAGASLFKVEPKSLAPILNMIKHRPDSSQAFIPMRTNGFLVIVFEDDNGKPGVPRALQIARGQAINFYRNTWHGVLTPLAALGLFAVLDRIGEGPNLEEH